MQDRIDFLRKDSVSKSRKSPDASEHYMEGDVLYDSWGYDQTNIDWYQITKVKVNLFGCVRLQKIQVMPEIVPLDILNPVDMNL